MDAWGTILRVVRVVLVLLVLALIGTVFLRKFYGLREMQDRRDTLRDENSMLETETASLRERQVRFATDPQFVERVARETGMVKPGEVVFLFTNETSDGQTPGSSQ